MVHAPNQPTRVRGFSLIEMLAVVLIFALMAMFVLPNFESVRSRALGHAAERIASRLELARQRTIVTGVPHRLWIDLDDDSYRLEWHVTEEDDEFRAKAFIRIRKTRDSRSHRPGSCGPCIGLVGEGNPRRNREAVRHDLLDRVTERGIEVHAAHGQLNL